MIVLIFRCTAREALPNGPAGLVMRARQAARSWEAACSIVSKGSGNGLSRKRKLLDLGDIGMMGNNRA